MSVLRLCAAPGCPELVERGRCSAHSRRRALNRQRPSARARGYDSRWEKARATYLAEHPACEHCALERAVSPAMVVDHIVPHRGDRELFWDRDNNWAALCAPCHGRKGMRESGLQPCEHGATRMVRGRDVCVLCGGAV